MENFPSLPIYFNMIKFRKTKIGYKYMILDLNKLNALEKEIYGQLTEYAKDNSTLKITEAAVLCNCSASKISKFVKKLGFDNFKQFVAFIRGETLPLKKSSNELQRIRDFTTSFDPQNVDTFISLLDTHKKIILFGYGPSYYCAQYLEYKLRIQSDAFIMTVPDIVTAENLIDDTTLLVILSTTGHFASFKNICEKTKENGGDIFLIVEEYHPELLHDYDNICFLTDTTQSADLAPHEKSRIVFFIFIEEVIFEIIRRTKEIG